MSSFTITHYQQPAGGWGSLRASLRSLRQEHALTEGSALLLKMNQAEGFDCPGCAWGDPEAHSSFEFCENGVNAVAAEATGKRVTADAFAAHTLAQRLGIPRDSLIRAEAGVAHVLQELSGEGHCACAIDTLLTAAEKLLEIPRPILAEAIDREVGAGRLIREPVEDADCVFLAPLYYAEVGVANQIQRLLPGPLPWGAIDIEKALPWVEEVHHLSLSTSQKDALRLALQSKVCIVTGGPGVGKEL